ncbi:MAG TPA: hypothetical protein VGM86_34805 [Thermoanaerobaculia bacterium]|jgi:hypothetical protein
MPTGDEPADVESELGMRLLDDRQILTEEELLPGFSVPVAELFPES